MDVSKIAKGAPVLNVFGEGMKCLIDSDISDVNGRKPGCVSFHKDKSTGDWIATGTTMKGEYTERLIGSLVFAREWIKQQGENEKNFDAAFVEFPSLNMSALRLTGPKGDVYIPIHDWNNDLKGPFAAPLRVDDKYLDKLKDAHLSRIAAAKLIKAAGQKPGDEPYGG